MRGRTRQSAFSNGRWQARPSQGTSIHGTRTDRWCTGRSRVSAITVDLRTRCLEWLRPNSLKRRELFPENGQPTRRYRCENYRNKQITTALLIGALAVAYYLFADVIGYYMLFI